MFEHPTELTLVHDTPESYLLDACVAISAYQEHFPFVQFPEIWDDLLREAKLGRVAIPPQIMSEIEPNENEFTEWLKQKKARDILQLGEAIDQSVVDRVIRDGYAKDLTVPEHIKLGRDPVLIAYACVQPGRRVVVTDEKSEPEDLPPENQKKRANRKIPDVCRTLGIPWISGAEYFETILGHPIPSDREE